MNRNQKHIQAVLDLATAGEYADGKRWYARANGVAERLHELYGISKPRAAGVIAALSPRNRWERNVIDAENIVATCQAAGSIDDVKVCTFRKNKEKAIAVLSDCLREEYIPEVLSGPKMIEFYNCIMGCNDVTIDGHAYSIWYGDRVTLANVPKIGKKIREKIKKDYLAVGRNNAMMGYEVQAITWLTHRRIHGVTK